jgi:hypothetical protein
MNDTPALPPTQAPKRIVVEHANGIMQICGLVSEGQPDEYITRDISGWEYDVQLVASKPRYWLYRAVQKPAGLGTFNPAQR